MTRPACPVCGSPVNTAGETRCWRHRRAGRPIAPGKRRTRSGHRDPVTGPVWAAVRDRDGGCVGPRAGLDGPCDGPLEIDHVLNGGMALRGPSTIDNLVTLCRRHHRYKTENARVCRRLLVAYLSVRQRRAAGAGRP